VSDFEEHCFECDEPIRMVFGSPTAPTWTHDRTGHRLCYPQRPDSTYAEVCPQHEWRESETYCEDCGSHPAVYCPVCDRTIDTVMSGDPREDSE